MKKNDFSPVALPTIPPCKYVYHVIRRVSPHGAVKWVVRRAMYNSYVLRLRHHGDDGMYFASEIVAKDYAEIKQKYEMDVAPHAPQGVQP